MRLAVPGVIVSDYSLSRSRSTEDTCAFARTATRWSTHHKTFANAARPPSKWRTCCVIPAKTDFKSAGTKKPHRTPAPSRRKFIRTPAHSAGAARTVPTNALKTSRRRPVKKYRKLRKESPQTRLRREEMRRRGYVSPMDAAALSRTPLQTIYTWIREKKLRPERIGARRLFVSLLELKKLAGPSMVTARIET